MLYIFTKLAAAASRAMHSVASVHEGLVLGAWLSASLQEMVGLLGAALHCTLGGDWHLAHVSLMGAAGVRRCHISGDVAAGGLAAPRALHCTLKVHA